jgi:hypothetical protein
VIEEATLNSRLTGYPKVIIGRRGQFVAARLTGQMLRAGAQNGALGVPD